MISLVTGLLFSIIITRNLSSEEFGVWGNISDLLAYFTLMGSVIPSWSLRFFARGYVKAKETGVVVNTLISVIMWWG